MDGQRVTDDLAPALPAPPEALVRDTWVLDPPAPYERSHVDRPEAAALVDGLLARVARGHGALDVAIAAVLSDLAAGDRLLRLGFARLRDYARERLDLGETASRNLAKLGRALRDRPLLREALQAGEVSARKAQAILKVAHGEAEAAWVARARTETVRSLEAAVRAASQGATAEPPDQVWERLDVEMTPAERKTLDGAFVLAGKVLGAASPKWQRLEAICQEYLGSFPSEPAGDEALHPAVLCGPVADWLESAKEGLEQEMNRWDFLEEVPSVPAPLEDPAAAAPDDVHQLDARLRELAAMRERWDVLLGHLAMLMKNVGLWRDAGFASFGHYCEERLGLSTRNVEQRAALARRCYWVPEVREAMKAGRLSYERARLVARVADEHTMGDWIRRAQAMTVVELRREVDGVEDTQTCARGELDLRVPREVRILVDAVVRTARASGTGSETSGECIARAAEHFVEVWERAVRRPRTPAQKAVARDGGLCTVPGCSSAAVHAHHVVRRSAGGSDELSNLTSLCVPHHLHGVHGGWIVVRGEAPDRLSWVMPAPRGSKPV